MQPHFETPLGNHYYLFDEEVKIKLPASRPATAERPTGWIAGALSRADDRMRLLGVAGASGLFRGQPGGPCIGLSSNDRR